MNDRVGVSDASEFANNRGVALSASRQTARLHPAGCPPLHRHSLSLHSNSDPPVEKQRRRISIACSRCRKRKIKCSGDPGNGMGCQNCRQAGAGPGECQFHRVQSTPADSPDIYHFLSRMQPSTPRLAFAPRLDVYGMPSGSFGNVSPPYFGPGRRDQPTTYPYGGSQVALSYPPYYSLQTSESVYAHLLPLQPAISTYPVEQSFHSHAVAYEPQDPQHQWPAATATDRGAPVPMDQDPPPPTAPASTADDAAADEPRSVFPAMGTLASSLPPSHHLAGGALAAPSSAAACAQRTTTPAPATHPPCAYAFEGRPSAAWSSERSTAASHMNADPADSAPLPAPSRASTVSSAGGRHATCGGLDGCAGAPFADTYAYAAAGGRWRRGEVAAADGRLLNGQAYQPYTQLRHIQPAQAKRDDGRAAACGAPAIGRAATAQH